MAADIPITEAEAVVMQALWKQGEAMTSEAVVAALADQDWQEPTIRTLLNRLLNKGAIQAEPPTISAKGRAPGSPSLTTMKPSNARPTSTIAAAGRVLR